MHDIKRSRWLPLFILLSAMAIAIIACGNGIQPENMRITASLQADCGGNRVATTAFAFGEAAFTDATEMLDLRLQIDIIRTQLAAQEDTLLVVYRVAIENRGDMLFALLPSLQIFVSSVGGQSGIWGTSGAALGEAGLSLDSNLLDVIEITGGSITSLDMAAYTPIGTIDSITVVLDPLPEALPNTARWQTVNPVTCLEE